MFDPVEIKTVKRLMRWVTILSGLVGAQTTKTHRKALLPDPYSAALVKRMLNNYENFKQFDFGFGLLNDQSLDGIFLYLLVMAEFEFMPWGRALQHLILEGPYMKKNGGGIRLSRLPFILLPQECVVTGQRLPLNRRNYNSAQGHAKGRIKSGEARDGWKPMQKKLRAAFEAGEALEGITDRSALLAQHRKNFSVLWSAYKVLIEKLDAPYTPRYLLFEECQDIAFEEIFFNLFFYRFGRDTPINQKNLPHLFDASLGGKRISDFENAAGQAVDGFGRMLGPDYITLKQLDDYFIYR
jgi:hypothetical protein